MKKAFKSFVSILCALSVSASMVTALAQTQTGTGYWKQSFDGLTAVSYTHLILVS